MVILYESLQGTVRTTITSSLDDSGGDCGVQRFKSSWGVNIFPLDLGKPLVRGTQTQVYQRCGAWQPCTTLYFGPYLSENVNSIEV